MFLGYFTERPYQDPKLFGETAGTLTDLSLSNGIYDPELAASLYHRYFDEKLYVEEMGFDGAMLNAHHSTPFCMGGGPMNLEAAILARITEKLKIVLLGNILPIWDDPLWLVEELTFVDVLSRGRLVSGFVRGTGRESLAHNASPTYNWERFQEAHDFIVKAWTTPGPFNWDGAFYQYRYVNPWLRPYQQPHPQIWIPGILSRSTVAWAAQHRYPYVMVDSTLDLTVETFEYYREQARAAGYEAGTQHLGYMLRVHVDETEELANETGRKLIEGPGNIFLEGSSGSPNPWIQRLPGMRSRDPSALLPTARHLQVAVTGGAGLSNKDVQHAAPAATPAERARRRSEVWQDQLDRQATVVGTPDSIIPKLRRILETVRPGMFILWSGDGSMTHEETMRCLRLMGDHVLPALREIGKELELNSSFEVDPATNDLVQPAMPGTA